jgi:hypothetical protein
MSNRIVHVARAGKVIGQYPPEQLASLLDSGPFFESDLCHSESHPEWTPMPEFLKLVAAPKYSKAHAERPRPPESGRSSRRGHRSRHDHSSAMLSGWVAFLVAVAALLGAGYWISSLYQELAARTAQVDDLGKQLEGKDKEIQKLIFASREIAENGIIRGSLVLRNEAGKRVAMPGQQVLLFPRKDIEAYLEARAAQLAQEPSDTPINGPEYFSTALPKPLDTTTTDASGRFEFPIAEPGEYVIFTRLGVLAQGAQQSRIWFVAFNSNDPLNTIISLDDMNAVQQFIPSLMIIEGR